MKRTVLTSFRSAILSDSLGLPLLGFTLEWHSKHAKSLEAITAQDVRRDVEHAISQSATTGMQCVYVAWRQLSKIQPSPTDVQLLAGGLPSSAATAKEMSGQRSNSLLVRLQARPSDGEPLLHICLPKAFKASKLDGVAGVPFTLDIQGSILPGGQSLLAAQLVDILVEIIGPVARDRTHSTARDLTRVCGDSLNEQRKELSDILKVGDVGLSFHYRKGETKTYWTSRLTPSCDDESSRGTRLVAPRYEPFGSNQSVSLEGAGEDARETVDQSYDSQSVAGSSMTKVASPSKQVETILQDRSRP